MLDISENDLISLSIKELMSKYGVSKSTILRHKRSLKDKESADSLEEIDTTNNSIVNNNTTTQGSQGRGGKREGAGRKSTNKVENDMLILYNTIYHASLTELNDRQKKMMKRLAEVKAAKNWWCVIYPDSDYTPKNWVDIARGWLEPIYISPLHSEDENADGEKKKPHYHLILKCCQQKTPLEVATMFADIGGIIENKPISNITGAVRYLIHKDNPEKAQYSVNDVKAYNGADLLTDMNNSVDENEILAYLLAEIKKKRKYISSYYDLLTYYTDVEDKTYLNYISHNSYLFVNIYKSLKNSTFLSKAEVDRLIAEQEAIEARREHKIYVTSEALANFGKDKESSKDEY